MSAHSVTAGATRTTVERWYTALTAGDEEAWLALHDQRAVCFIPVGTAPLGTRDDLRRHFRGLWRAFERLAVEPVRIWGASDGAAVTWRAKGTGRNGREVTFEGVDVFELDPLGLIRTLWSYWDPVEVAEPLGA